MWFGLTSIKFDFDYVHMVDSNVVRMNILFLVKKNVRSMFSHHILQRIHVA